MTPLSPPHSCQGRPPLLASLLVCGPRPGPPPAPPRLQTTGSFSSASSDLQAPDPVSVPPPGSSAERGAHSSLFSLLKPPMEDGRPRSSLSLASSASTISSLSGLSTKVRLLGGAGEEPGGALGSPILLFPSPAFGATQGTPVVKSKDL